MPAPPKAPKAKPAPAPAPRMDGSIIGELASRLAPLSASETLTGETAAGDAGALETSAASSEDVLSGDSGASSAPAEVYISFYCPRCDTLMKATPSQVGEPRECPDCLSKFVVPKLTVVESRVESARPVDDLEFAGGDMARPTYQPFSQRTIDAEGFAEAKRSEAAKEAAAAAAHAVEPARRKNAADVIQFSCQVCGSGLQALRTQVGMQVQCTDCLTSTSVPQEKAPPKKTTPKEFEDDIEAYAEFGLSDVANRPQPYQDQAKEIARKAMERAEALEAEKNLPTVSGAGSSATGPAVSPSPHSHAENATGPSNGGGARSPMPRPADHSDPARDAPKPPPVSPEMAALAGRARIEVSAAGSGHSPVNEPTVPAGSAVGGVPPQREGRLGHPVQTRKDSGGDRKAARTSSARAFPLPAWAAVQGVPSFLMQPGCIHVALVMTLGLSIEFMGFAFVSKYLTNGPAMIGGILVIVALVGMAVPLAMFFNASHLEILKDTANGVEESQTPPDDWFIEWFSNGAMMLGAAAFGGLPASLLAQVIDLGSPLRNFMLLVVSEGIFFPVMLLSALESGTLFPPVSLSVWRTLKVARPAWIRFWTESAVLLVPIAITFKLIEIGTLTSVIASVIISITWLIYFRRLGVLGLICTRTINEQ